MTSGLASRLFDADVAVFEIDPAIVDPSVLLPEECDAVKKAVAERRRQFAAGRLCARNAMAAFGLPPVAIPVGEERVPGFPSSVVGTITHTKGWAAAAVARRCDALALGIDVEPDDGLGEKLFPRILVPEEEARLGALTPAERGLQAKVIFCAKEAAYKAQYVLSRTYLPFSAMRIDLDLATSTLEATFRREAGPFSLGDVLEGRFVVDLGYVMTGFRIDALPATTPR